MSFFARWLGKSSKKPASAPAAQHSVFAESLHTVQHDPGVGRPSMMASRSSVAPHAADGAPRPGERSARREMVYSAVRESMVRSGILSSGYKFKVLALDKRATQFIVMVDLAEQFCASPDKLGQIEALIAYSAKSRFEILVTSVYWRLNAQLGVQGAKSKADAPAATARTGVANAPTGVAASAPVVMGAAPVVAPQQPAVSATPGVDPVEEAEIEAFKKALLEAAMRPVPALEGAEAARPAPIVPARASSASAAENNERARQAARKGGTPAPTPDTTFGGLSATQYGDLN